MRRFRQFLLVSLVFVLTAQLLGPSLVYASETAVDTDGDARLTLNLGENIADVHIDNVRLWYPVSTDDHTAQDITYTYDPVGNITQIDDNSYTDARKLATFAYDDLYRLTSASSTDEGIELYHHTYSYDSIGNITNKSDQGTYTYNDDGYNNPHAADSIDGADLAYDNAGNLTSDGNLTLAWDYRNRLVTASSTSATSTYAYNHANQRIKKTSDGVDTIYPNRYHEVSGSTTTAYIFAGDELVATREDDGVAKTTYYIHPDHLNSTNVVSNEAGSLEQTLDYYPYGAERINDRNSVFDELRTFIGQYFDDESELSYLNARYYNGSRGQFNSQDLVFLAIGDVDQITEITGELPVQLLSDPQLLNSYAYGRGNPLRYSDPEGERAYGIGVNVLGGVPGLYAQQSAYAVIALSLNPFNLEFGLIESTEGGGTTAVTQVEGSVGLLHSPNAKSIKDLEGIDVGGGGSLRAGLSGAFDIGTSKPDNYNNRITTMTISGGFGLNITPYALPAEVHGGVSYTRSLGSINLTQSATNAYSATQNGTHSISASLQRQLNQIQSQINALKSAIEKRFQSQNSN